jgi:hypothetical protein
MEVVPYGVVAANGASVVSGATAVEATTLVPKNTPKSDGAIGIGSGCGDLSSITMCVVTIAGIESTSTVKQPNRRS